MTEDEIIMSYRDTHTSMCITTVQFMYLSKYIQYTVMLYLEIRLVSSKMIDSTNSMNQLNLGSSQQY